MSERSEEGRDIRTGTPPSEAPYRDEGGAFGRPSVEEEYRGGIGEKADEFAGRAREMASEYAEMAQAQVEVGKDQAASSMETAAQKLRERTMAQGGLGSQAGEKVAEGMESAAGYLREHSTGEIWDDVERYVRAHPMQALAGAAFAGFLLGRMLR
ncbi:MAG TPA: hypothetical protein VNN10_07160 [Dehalococcoidia bacterium]|nr:hypothetical protein [Dehalococcoidia bacterium]